MTKPTPTRITLKTPVGVLGLEGTDDALSYVLLPDVAAAGPPVPDAGDAAVLPAALDSAVAQLGEYFEGTRRAFDLPLELAGTPFQRAVWRALADIPYGQTISYAELAAMVGRPGAFRAVGQANGANPVPIVLPCHRVVSSGGGIGGYGGGLELKRRLLALEGVHDL
jgi:methylated-DNA-[protein]-cysteine S-methyltransferase